MEKTITIVLLSSLFISSPAQKLNIPQVFADTEKQIELMLNQIPLVKTGELVSPRTFENGVLKLVPSRDWTSGFFPAELWLLYEYTGKSEWKQLARRYTANIEREKTNRITHDMGFKIYNSFGNGYRLTADENYKNIIIESATTLIKRFNKTAGVIKSWDNRPRWPYPVIIDNMMNLELLFAASRITGDKGFYDIAVSHANTTMKNHFRKDHSSYHVVDYDTATAGKINQKTTHQGYSDESAWSRGQSWGLYGFTMCYRETKDHAYLQFAERIADYIINHPKTPADRIPYYDYDAPGIPNEPRDASAAAIIASALYELSTYSNKGKRYKDEAHNILSSLTNHYRSSPGENKGFILLHSTGEKPKNSEVDVPIIYADYYYLEALLRCKKLSEGKKLFAN